MGLSRVCGFYHRAVPTVWGRSSFIFHRQPCKLASPPSPPALEIPVAEVPGVAGREGWKTATAGRAEKPEQKREREGEKRTHTHSHGGRDRKASDRSGHYGGEACWELGRLASDPPDADTAWDRKPRSPDTVAPGAAPIWGRKQTHCPPLRTLILGV